MTSEYSQNIEQYLPNNSIINLFDKEKKSVNEYRELFTDNDEKIIVIAPGHFEWKFTNEEIDKIPNLKAIITRSSWGHYIDIEHAKEKNIIIARSPGANAQSVAEYALFQMFALARKFSQQIKDSYKVGKSEEHMGIEVKGKTVGILGLGRIGQNIADMCNGLGAKVIYWSRNSKNEKYTYKSIDDVLKESDIIFKTWETIPETNKLLSKDNLKFLKKTALFISVFGGIGWSDDDEIILQMAENKQIGGFSIENEHHKDTKVKDIYEGNIFIPGAYAWFTSESQKRYGEIIAKTIQSILDGRPTNIVV